MQDNPPVSPLMEFMSSGAGVELNQAFLCIDDDKMRRRLLAMFNDIARVTSAKRVGDNITLDRNGLICLRKAVDKRGSNVRLCFYLGIGFRGSSR